MKNSAQHALLVSTFSDEPTAFVLFPELEAVFDEQLLPATAATHEAAYGGNFSWDEERYEAEQVARFGPDHSLTDSETEALMRVSIYPSFVVMLRFPLRTIRAEWEGIGYFIYNENYSGDGLRYTTQAGRIVKLEGFAVKNSDHKNLRPESLDVEFEYAYKEQLAKLRQSKEKYLAVHARQFEAAPLVSLHQKLAALQENFEEADFAEKMNQCEKELRQCQQENNLPAYPHDAFSEIDEAEYAPFGRYFYPMWVQNGGFLPIDSAGKTMEYVADISSFDLNLQSRYSYLFYSPETQEFTQIDQVT